MLQPIGNRVLVKLEVEEEVTASGIVLPDTVEKKTKAQGAIVALGSGEELQKLNLKEGDKVLFGKYSGDEVEIEGAEHKILAHEDILAVFKS